MGSDFLKKYGIQPREEATGAEKKETEGFLERYGIQPREEKAQYEDTMGQWQKGAVDAAMDRWKRYQATQGAVKEAQGLGWMPGVAPTDPGKQRYDDAIDWSIATQKAEDSARAAALEGGQQAKEQAAAMQGDIDAAKGELEDTKSQQSGQTWWEVFGKAGEAAGNAMAGTPGPITPYSNSYQGQIDGQTKHVEELEGQQRELMFQYYSSLFAAKDFEKYSQQPTAAADGEDADYFIGMAGGGTHRPGQMSEDEVAIYNYLYNTQGTQAAKEFVDFLGTDLDARWRLSKEQAAADYAKKDPVGASVGSVLLSPLKVGGYLMQVGDYLADGEIDPNATYNLASYQSNAIRSTVGGMVDDAAGGGFWGAAAKLGYDTTMSMGDFLLDTAVSGGSKTLSLAIMGSGAATDTVIQAKDMGLSDDQAFWLGAVAGGAEVVMEKIGMDALFDAAFRKSKGTLMYVLKQALSEGGEEVGTELINTMADVIIAGDQSQMQRAIDAYMAADPNMSESEAFGLWLRDKALEIGVSFAGGALSGGVMGGGMAAIDATQVSALASKIDKGSVYVDLGSVVAQGLELDPASNGYALAQMIEAQVEAGEVPSSKDVARLMLTLDTVQGDGQAEESAVDGEENVAATPPSSAPFGGTLPRGEGLGADVGVGDYGTARPGAVTDQMHGAALKDTTLTAEEGNAGEGAIQSEDDLDPEWIGLPTLDDLTQEDRRSAGNDTADAAELTRQNGGSNEQIDGQRTGLAVADTAGGAEATGAGVSDGGGRWDAGSGASQQTGGLGSGAASRSWAADSRRASVARQDRIRRLRLEKISSKSLGVASGTDARTVQEVTDEYWDDEMQRLAERIYNETGKEVRYVMGRIQIRGTDGNVRYVRGVLSGDQMIVQIDHSQVSMEQLADHEAYHAKVEASEGLLNHEIRQHIIDTFSEEEFTRVVEKYIISLRGVYDVGDIETGEAYEQLIRDIEEEVFADAYAGINAFGAGADRFTEAVNERMDQLYMGKIREQDNGTAEPTGPPKMQKNSTAGGGGERYSSDADQDTSLDYLQSANMTADELQEGEAVAKFIQKVGAMIDTAKRSKRKMRIGTVSQNHADLISKLMQAIKPGFSADGYDLWLDGTGASHIESRHGEFGKQDHSMESVEAKMLIPWASQNADSCDFILDGKGRIRRSSRFLNSDGSRPPEISMEKSLGDDTVYVSECVPDSGNRRIWITSAYIKKGSTGQKLNMEDGSSPQPTPEAIFDSSATTDIVATPRPSVKDRFSYAGERVRAADLDALELAKEPRDGVGPVRSEERYSVDDTDSRGNELSSQQQEYFRDSQVRDELGKLLLVYHGSKAVFTEYDHSKINSHGSAEGRGFYFTDNLSMAEGYGSETGQVLRGYLNITKPLSLDERTITKAQVRQLLKTVDPSGDDVILNFDPMGGMGYPSKAWYDRSLREAVNTIHEYNDNDADLLAEIANSGAGDKMVMLAARELFGYDGYIAKGKYDDATVYVAFDSDQFKNADNTKPTKSKDFRYSVDDTDGIDDDRSPEEKKKPSQKRKKDTKPVAESLPLIAKKDLRWTVTSLFSIPDGQRAELGAVIDGYADRLIKNGTLTEEDRQAFFDRMYESGVMTVPANDHYAEARNYLKGGKIYVSDSVVEDFGDDWGDIRRRAFAAGIYLTRSQISGGHNVTGIDSWNADLAEDLPGLFNSDETDQRIILERIVQVAEEGRDENLSLAEYTARLAERESISEDEFLDNMERQLDWALRTFAEKARLEVHLRDRTGKKITQEREGFAARTSKMRIKEAQRRADERQDRKNAAERAKARRELSEMQQKTMKQLRWLNKNRNRAPEELRAIWDEVLGDIDLYAVSAANELNWSEKYNATWKDLAQMYKDAQKNDPNFMPSKELERIVARLDGTKIGEMDVGALQDLYKAAIGLRTEFYNRNNVINDEMHRLFAEVYSDSKREIQAAPGGFKGSKVDKFFNMDQLTPMNVLERMGGWDPNGAFYSMAKQLEKGERDQRAYTVKAQKMLQEFLEEHEDWVKKADGQGKDAVWYEVEVPELLELHMGDKPIFGDTAKVYMTPAQKVHLYLESKNLDNLRHMTGGRTFVDKDLYSKGKRQEALAQGKTIRLAPETVRALVNDLTAEEMELAQLLDRYYNGFATQEINKVSNVLHGYDKAMGKNYAPIYTNRNYTKSEFGVFDSTAEGVGNLKERQRSANPSYNISCFDAFERHVDQTARFCGMAIPTRNWTQLMNWRERDNSTADVISHKWGDEGKKYIADLINTLQGGDDGKSDTVSSVAGKLQSNYISAIFGANPSIVLKQLGSIPLAGAYLGAGNMPNPAQIARIDRGLIQKYTQELEWRTMGYTTPETKFLKENPNWTQTNKAFKFLFGGGAITAMDGWAASTLWPWAENKVRKEHPDLEVGTQEQIDNGESPFYKKVAEEFDNAVSRSQSVSDEIHQGTMRKSKNPIARAFTLFRSDSAQSYNALRQKVGEARFLAKNGSGKGAVKAAKIAVGVTFGAILINAAWAEAISFLMALWKNKGKKYRDDEEELTAQSVIGEIVTNMMGSLAGVTIGGEELFELVGNILTGDTWYGIDTPGMEQLNDMLDAIVESGGDIRELVTGAWDVFQNGGDLGEYFRKNSGKLLGCIKEIAETTATYMTGLPAGNVEAYLIGALKWVSPELGAAYDDTFSEVGKSDLAGTEGDALASRVGRILADRKVSDSDETAQVLATLYEEGYKAAVPSDTPSSISINGESRTLSPYQQQTYDAVWGSIVSDGLDELVSSDAFAEADAETQEKMLKNLYSYAAEQAKATLFDDYELDSGAAKNAAIISAGASVAECIIWNATTSDMDSGEKSAELATWDLPEITKRAIFYRKISDSREEEISAFTDAGLTFDQFLVAYSKYGEINGMDLSASEKAVKFSYWVDGQNYTSKQANVVKDELVFYGMTPAGAGNYDKFSDAGMGPEDALGLSDALGGLEPEAGSDRVTNTQKWRACVDYYDDTDDQLTALYAVMTPTQYQKVEIAYDYGVSPDSYVTLQEILPDYDVDGNGAYKQDEVTAAIEGMPGSYTKTQKAVMWQLATGSKSAKNNPYSKKVGQQVIDARESAGDSEDKTFSQEVQDQMQGRG